MRIDNGGVVGFGDRIYFSGNLFKHKEKEFES